MCPPFISGTQGRRASFLGRSFPLFPPTKSHDGARIMDSPRPYPYVRQPHCKSNKYRLGVEESPFFLLSSRVDFLVGGAVRIRTATDYDAPGPPRGGRVLHRRRQRHPARPLQGQVPHAALRRRGVAAQPRADGGPGTLASFKTGTQTCGLPNGYFSPKYSTAQCCRPSARTPTGRA